MPDLKVQQIQTPSDLYVVSPKGVIPSLVDAFYKHAQAVIDAPFTITDYAQNDVEGKWTVKLLFESGEVEALEIPYQDLQDELSLTENRQVQRAFTESMGIDVPTYKDGYTRAATHYFETENIKESKLLGSWNSDRPRLVVSKGLIHITKGFSRIEAIFRRIFQPKKMAAWENQNRESIDAYLSFMKKEIGEEKLTQIQKIYRFDFDKMREKGLPLEPKHIYFCNIGMNNIEMDDVTSFGKRASQFFGIYGDSEKMLPILKSPNHPFTSREARAIQKKLGTNGTVGDLHIALGGVFNQPFPSEYFTESTFGKITSILETPREEWEALYTGRKFKSPIKGSYNTDVTDRKTFRPWVDQQELLQFFRELKDPFPDRSDVNRKKVDHYFYEALCKIVVKKHLMRSLSPNDWRVGALIPSPYKNEKGETVYYRVDQGVDSGHGKMWYVFRPACEDYDHSFPVIRVPRDTSPDQYAMRGGPTLTRDLAKHAGSLYSSTTLDEDREFFREFTLPAWMGRFSIAINHIRKAETTEADESLFPYLKEVHQQLHGEIQKRMLEGKLEQEEGQAALKVLVELLTKVKNTSGKEQMIAAKSYIANVFLLAPYDPDDYSRLIQLLEGKTPRPIASVGSSLGGFDAQNDLYRQTVLENRIPISNLDLYTHSTLKIDKGDDNCFTNFFLAQKDLLEELGVRLHIHHVTELDDKVSLVTDGTFLGQGLQMVNEQHERLGKTSPFDVSLRVFKMVSFSENEQVQNLKVHLRRIEHLEEGSDYIFIKGYTSIKDYDHYASTYRFKGRRLEAWRKTGTRFGLAETSDLIWRSWRHFFDLAHTIPKENTNDKLVVVYNPEGKKQHAFIPTRLTPSLDKLFVRNFKIENTF